MDPQPSALVTVWYCLLGFDLLAYVALDGYDLGVGIASLFSRGEEERSAHLQAIEAVWDANETWLVLFGGMLFGAFPSATACCCPPSTCPSCWCSPG